MQKIVSTFNAINKFGQTAGKNARKKNPLMGLMLAGEGFIFLLCGPIIVSGLAAIATTPLGAVGTLLLGTSVWAGASTIIMGFFKGLFSPYQKALATSPQEIQLAGSKTLLALTAGSAFQVAVRPSESIREAAPRKSPDNATKISF